MAINLRGADVSEHNGVIDFSQLKNNVDFLIIRSSYGSNDSSQDDGQAARNVAQCEKYKIPYGVYHFLYAESVAAAKSEAQHCLRVIKECKATPTYGVWLDIENDGNYKPLGGTLSAEMLKNITVTFCETIEAAGYYVGIYSNPWAFENNRYLGQSDILKYDKWCAEWGSKCTYKGDYGIWQYTDSGTLPGISTPVDMNQCYRNYPSLSAKTSAGVTMPDYSTGATYTDSADESASSSSGTSWSQVINEDGAQKKSVKITGSYLVFNGEYTPTQLEVALENYYGAAPKVIQSRRDRWSKITANLREIFPQLYIR